MFLNEALVFIALAAIVSTAVCPEKTRLASCKQVIYAYNLNSLGASEEAFKAVPWGAPDAGGSCPTFIYADGACPVPVSTTGSGTYQFAVESRQVFSHLTGKYVSFPNGTTMIDTNVTLGIRSELGIPITFHAHVYMDYNDDCRIYQAQAYAQVPISVLNLAFSTAGIPSLPAPVCNNEP